MNGGDAIASTKAMAEIHDLHPLRTAPRPVESVELAPGDYISPGFWAFLPDAAFPHMQVGDPRIATWPYLRRSISHNWYVDARHPTVGFVNRDEASILFNTARLFVGKRCLEIGCWRGWSTVHLLAGSGRLDVLDPALADATFRADVMGNLARAGVAEGCVLHATESPKGVADLAKQDNICWSLIFIDGNHEAPGPTLDAQIVAKYAADDALVLFHDLMSPDVADGLAFFRECGWRTMIYQTAQIMGVAWRGSVEPIRHVPDPAQTWELPDHLRTYGIIGERSEDRAARLGASLDALIREHCSTTAGAPTPSSEPAEGDRRTQTRIGALIKGLNTVRTERVRFEKECDALREELASSSASSATLLEAERRRFEDVRRQLELDRDAVRAELATERANSSHRIVQLEGLSATLQQRLASAERRMREHTECLMTEREERRRLEVEARIIAQNRDALLKGLIEISSSKAQLESEIRAIVESRDSLAKELADINSATTDIHAELRGISENRDSLFKGMVDLAAAKADIEAECGRLGNKLYQLEIAYGAVLNSRSWRAMGPVRRFTTYIRPLYHRLRRSAGGLARRILPPPAFAWVATRIRRSVSSSAR